MSTSRDTPDVSSEPRKVFFTSDSHFFHANVIKYSNRPFSDVDGMNSKLISNWNTIVGPEDTVYHLGDFSFAKKASTESILSRLNGHKHLVFGNHDSKDTKSATGWASVQPYLEVTVEGQFLVLFHYSCRVWNKSHYGSINLYGHSHGRLPGTSQSQDVGVDAFSYKPVSLREIRERLATSEPYVILDR